MRTPCDRIKSDRTFGFGGHDTRPEQALTVQQPNGDLPDTCWLVVSVIIYVRH